MNTPNKEQSITPKPIHSLTKYVFSQGFCFVSDLCRCHFDGGSHLWVPKHTPPCAPPSWKGGIRVGSRMVSVECLCTTDVAPAPCTASLKVSLGYPLYMANKFWNPHTLRMEPVPHSRRLAKGRVRRGEGFLAPEVEGERRNLLRPSLISMDDTYQHGTPRHHQPF